MSMKQFLLRVPTQIPALRPRIILLYHIPAHLTRFVFLENLIRIHELMGAVLTKVWVRKYCGRRGGLMVSVLDCASRDLGTRPSPVNVVYMCSREKHSTLSHSVSPPGNITGYQRIVREA